MMKKRKSGLLQRMMAVLLSAVLVTGMVSNAVPTIVFAQEDGETVETTQAEESKEPAKEETKSGEQDADKPDGSEDTNLDDPETEDKEDSTPGEPETGDQGNGEPENPETGDQGNGEPENPETGDQGNGEPENPETGDQENGAPEDGAGLENPEPETDGENTAADEETEILQALLARIDALPDAEEYLAGEPDTNNGEVDVAAYEEWLAGLYAYAEEALAIQEAVKELSEEKQAEIPEEAFAKLAAWAEAAQTAGESAQVMTVESSMVMAAEPAPQADNSGDWNGLHWEFDSVSGTLTISGSGEMGDKGSSGWGWYSHHESIQKVVIASGVTDIGTNAFYEYSNLTEVTIPDTVKKIRRNAFYRCISLSSVRIPNSVEVIDVNAFLGCGLTSITIPGSVKNVPDSMCYECSSLESVTIENGVETIGNQAFYKCTKLTNLTIPGSVTSIGTAFSSCTSLKDVTFQGTDTIPTLHKYCFENLYGQKAPCVGYGAKGLHIPSCQYLNAYLNTEGWDAYRNNIDAPHTLNYTASGAAITQTCSGCSLSATATLSTDNAEYTYTGNAIEPAKITYSTNWVGEKPEDIVYENNTNPGTATAKLTVSGATAELSFTIRDANIASGTDWTLDANGKLTIHSDNGMKNWKENGLSNNADKVSSLEIARGVETIPNSAFYECQFTEVDIPEGVKTIGNSAFYKCNKMTAIRIPDTVTKINVGAFESCTSLKTVRIPDEIETIETSTFANCRALESVTLPRNLKKINNYAFRGCSSLKTLELPGGLQTIGINAFENCQALKEVTIPASVNEISFGAFEKCSVLEKVTLLGDTPPTIGSYVFGRPANDNMPVEPQPATYCKFVTDQAQGIHVPEGKARTYKEAWTEWAAYIAGDTEMTDAEKVAAAKTVVENALANFNATNDTERDDVEAAILKALSNAGMTDVTATITTWNSLDKATTSHEGKITVWVNVHPASTGEYEPPKVYQMVKTELVIPKLPDTPPTPAEKYTVTVNNGTGGGEYKAGATVTVMANAAPSGKEFDKWEVNSGGVTLADATSSTTSFTMPAGAVSVTATYKDKSGGGNQGGGNSGNDGSGSGGSGGNNGSSDNGNGSSGENNGGGHSGGSGNSGGSHGGNSAGGNNGGSGTTDGMQNGGNQAGGGSDGNSQNGGSAGGNGGTGTTAPAPAGQPRVKQEQEGNIRKEVSVTGEHTLDASVAAPISELVDMVLTQTEKQQAADGTNIQIVLDVKEMPAAVGAADRAVVEAALNSSLARGYTLGQYLDISLYKVVGDSRSAITQTNRKITVTIQVPDSLKNSDSTKTRTFAVIRVHDGKAQLLPDLDSNAETITIETDRFSIYAIVYQDTANADGGISVMNLSADSGNITVNAKSDSGQKADGGMDDEPQTGDATPIELCATLSMIAGFTYLLLYFADRKRGMTEETKKELVSRLIGWGKQGGRIRKYLALAAIFVLLVYYHSIGKKVCVEWKEVYEE